MLFFNTIALLLLSLACTCEGATQKVKHLVVLYMENRPFDHMLGCMANKDGILPHADGIFGNETIWRDPKDHSKGSVTVTCGTAKYVCPNPPGFDLFRGHFAPDANAAKYPYAEQTNAYDYVNGARDVAIEMFDAAQLPVKRSIVENFATFDRFYTSVPSASYPNHMFTQSGTSCGVDTNVVDFKKCGGDTNTFPMTTIYDSMAAEGVPFYIFYNDTPTSADLFMAGIARHKDRIILDTNFYGMAENGTLPAFSFVIPGKDPRNGEPNNDHPCHDIALGERLHKDVYEALRAGPGWNETALLIVYDDAGGFYDHHIAPQEGVPGDNSACTKKFDHGGCEDPFDFRRLGMRTTALLLSPWVGKRALVKAPKRGPLPTSQWDHTSILATIKTLFNLPRYLSDRDAWAGNFEELFTEANPRQDCPMHLPQAPPPSVKPGRHSCGDLDAITRRQRRDVVLLKHLMPDLALPDLTDVKHDDLVEWLRGAWRRWFAGDYPVPSHDPEL